MTWKPSTCLIRNHFQHIDQKRQFLSWLPLDQETPNELNKFLSINKEKLLQDTVKNVI